MQTDRIGGCEKKVNTERSQALVGTTNLFRKLRRGESAAKERTKAKMLLIFAHLLLPYRENGCAVYLPFSIGTVRPDLKNGTAVVRSHLHSKTDQLRQRLQRSTAVQRCEHRYVILAPTVIYQNHEFYKYTSKKFLWESCTTVLQK